MTTKTMGETNVVQPENWGKTTWKAWLVNGDKKIQNSFEIEKNREKRRNQL